MKKEEKRAWRSNEDSLRMIGESLVSYENGWLNKEVC